MHSLALLVAAASLGVDYGWQPTDDGKVEYIIQMEPSLVNLLKQGQEIVSEIHPDAKNVRRFRILVGKGELPRVNPPEPAREPDPEPELERQLDPDPPLERPKLGIDARADARQAGPARIEFKPDFDPAAAEQPVEPFSPPSKRRRGGGEFGAPERAEEFADEPKQLSAVERLPAANTTKHRTVGHTEQAEGWKNQATAAEINAEKLEAAERAKAANKPWFPLTVTILLLFGSLGGNAYLGWIAKDFYNRYKSLAEELREPRPVDA